MAMQRRLSTPRARIARAAVLLGALSLLLACEKSAPEAGPETAGTSSGEEGAGSEGAAVADGAEAPEEATPTVVLPTGPGRPWDGEAGSVMPEYSAQRLDGTTLSLSELRGRPVVLSFWATWCVPCREEFPVLADLRTRLGPAGLEVLGVSLDTQASAAEIEAFAQENGLDYTVLFDPAMAAEPVFGVPPIPGNFVFDSEGRLVYRNIGGSETSVATLVVAAEAVAPGP